METEKQLYSYTEAWLNKDIKVDHVIRYLEGLEEHAEDAGDRDMALHYYRARLIVLMVNGFTNYTVSIILRTDIHGRVVPQPEVERAQAGGSTTAERAGTAITLARMTQHRYSRCGIPSGLHGS